MTAGPHFHIPARLRTVAGTALLAFAAIAAPATAKAFSPDAAADAQIAAAGPVSTAATGARCIGPAFDDTPAFQAAIDTGHTVYAPALGGRCHITHALVMRTPGQIFHGDGRARTKIVIEPGFAGEGVFVAKTGEPGPVWRDFSVSFVQPDVDDRAKLTRYPPAFSAPDTPRFEMEHLGCYVATMCVDMKGNSGGATIADLQMSALEVGIDIDGSLDTVRITDPHWWPFGLSKKLQGIFYEQGKSRSIALQIGRLDGLVVRGGLFYGGGVAIVARKTSLGFLTAGLVTETNFDSGSGLLIEAGDLLVSTSSFFVALPGAKGLEIVRGNIVASGDDFTGRQDPLVALLGGSSVIDGCRFKTDEADVTSIQVGSNAAYLTLNSSIFTRAERLRFQKSTVTSQGGTVTLTGNWANKTFVLGNSFFQSTGQRSNPKMGFNSTEGWSIIAR